MKNIYLIKLKLVFFILFISCNQNKQENNKSAIIADSSFNEVTIEPGMAAVDGRLISKQKAHEKAKTEIYPYLNELGRKVVVEGSKAAWSRMEWYYSYEGRGEGLGYSLVMANKYNNAEAYLNVFDDLAVYFSNVKTNYFNVPEMDNKTRNLALYYLVRSYELEETYMTSCYMHEVFERGKIPRHPSSYYLMEIIKEDAKMDMERKKK